MQRREFQIWKTIPGYPSYQVSNMGQFRSVFGIFTRVLRPWCYKTKGRVPKKRWLITVFEDDGRRKDLSLPRTVLTTFRRKPRKGEMALHWDDDSSNNKLSNLRWGYHSDNQQDRVRNKKAGRFTGHRNPAKLTRLQIIKLRSEYQPGVHGHGTVVLAEKYGISHGFCYDLVTFRKYPNI